MKIPEKMLSVWTLIMVISAQIESILSTPFIRRFIMANTTVKFDSLITFLRSRSSAVIRHAVSDLAFEGLLCVHQYRTSHALNQALDVLKTVQGGNTVLKYWREVAPFAFSSAEGFHGKMKDKKWDVYRVPSFSDWKEAQKKQNKKTPYEQLMLIISREDFSVTQEQMASLLEALGAKKA